MNAQDKVIAACQKLWQSRGLRDFTMDELAAEAGLSKRTVYKYFRSKEEIIEAVVDRLIADVTDASDKVLAGEVEIEVAISDTLNYLFIRAGFLTSKRSLEDVSRYYPHIWNKINDFRAQRLDLMVTRLIDRRPGQPLHGIDVRIMKAIIKSSILNVLDPQFILENGFTFQEAARQVSRVLLLTFLNLRASSPDEYFASVIPE